MSLLNVRTVIALLSLLIFFSPESYMGARLFKKFGFSGSSDFFRTLGDRIGKGLFIICAAFGTIFLALGGSYAGNYDFSTHWNSVKGFWDCLFTVIENPIAILAYGGGLLLFGSLGTYKDQDRLATENQSLRSQSQELGQTKSLVNTLQEGLQEGKSKIAEIHKEHVITWLKGLFKQLKLNSSDRITIYYEDNDEFYLLARYSINPSFGKIHRQKFPLNQGVISKAWEHGSHTEKECPDNAQSTDAYITYMENQYSYTREKISSLTMKSCRYYAKAIIDAGNHIGVIVFESTSPGFLSNKLPEEIDTYCEEHQSQLSKFVRDSKQFDMEIHIKREGQKMTVEDDLLKLIKKKEQS